MEVEGAGSYLGQTRYNLPDFEYYERSKAYRGICVKTSKTDLDVR